MSFAFRGFVRLPYLHNVDRIEGDLQSVHRKFYDDTPDFGNKNDEPSSQDGNYNCLMVTPEGVGYSDFASSRKAYDTKDIKMFPEYFPRI